MFDRGGHCIRGLRNNTPEWEQNPRLEPRRCLHSHSRNVMVSPNEFPQYQIFGGVIKFLPRSSERERKAWLLGWRCPWGRKWCEGKSKLTEENRRRKKLRTASYLRGDSEDEQNHANLHDKQHANYHSWKETSESFRACRNKENIKRTQWNIIMSESSWKSRV